MQERNHNREDKIVAVTVTFNRAATLKKTILALESQTYPISKIVIVDNNSNEVNRRQILELAEGKAYIDVLHMKENMGGAGGFEQGMRYAQEKYCPDWYWIMDDDAYPRRNTLEKLLLHRGEEQMGCLAPLIWGVDWQEFQLYHHKVIERYYTVDRPKFSQADQMGEVERIDANAFVGTLFPKSTVEKVGFPDGRMFIYGDDTEYTTRINQYYKIYLIKDAVIDHNDPPVVNEVFGPQTYWKLYYSLRNKILIAKKYNKGPKKVIAILLLMRQSLWQIAYSMVRKGLGKYRFFRIRFVIKATFDGLAGKVGKTVKPMV